MEVPNKRQKKSYVTWSCTERQILVKKRIEEDIWFCGKNANSTEGWKKIAAELRNQLGEDKDSNSCKAQWNALVKKYKSFFKYRSGEGTGEEALAEEAKDWEYFEQMHAYAAQKDNYHPPFLIDNHDGILSMQASTSNTRAVHITNIREEATQSPSIVNDDSSSSSTTPKRARVDFHRLEKHILKRDKKIGKKISSLLAVFGQMVQTDYPHIDPSGLMLSSDSDSD